MVTELQYVSTPFRLGKLYIQPTQLLGLKKRPFCIHLNVVNILLIGR